jgi:hypothetical protein
MKTKTFLATLHQWPNKTYGLVIDTESIYSESPDHFDLEPLAAWEVQATSKSHVATAIIASLIHHDTTYTVHRLY